ncbi:hypothetical protein Nepgr_007253 [Nepenthes gracilis]|uniref:Uncharacterized protein n=1 Tax=Nepenthes gracilis TaxID=150966 RepID=A0AAD3XI45_NEPGR|nr:hypothetical protein Nepgr_007253 [Nepenthes gracilis]
MEMQTKPTFELLASYTVGDKCGGRDFGTIIIHGRSIFHRLYDRPRSSKVIFTFIGCLTETAEMGRK